jgi:hypothetical protein
MDFEFAGVAGVGGRSTQNGVGVALCASPRGRWHRIGGIICRVRPFDRGYIGFTDFGAQRFS